MRYLYSNKHWEINKEYNLDKLLYLMIDRPNYIYHDGNFVWFNDKCRPHREYDLPSNVNINHNDKTYDLFWCINNKFHREKSKPTIVYSNGEKAYYMNDNLVKREYSK